VAEWVRGGVGGGRGGGGGGGRAGGGQIAPVLRVRALPPYGWLARRRGQLGLLRQGDALSALDRSAQGVFQDRSARQRACRASESDGPDPRARRSAQAGGAGGALADRGAACRRSVPCARAPAAPPAHPCPRPPPGPAREPGAAVFPPFSG